MRDVQKPDHVSLNGVLNWLREGRFRIPDFQREFEWKPWDISELMRSIFLDYFIGSLLLWKGKDMSFDALACEPIYGFKGDGKPTYIVLDGQQRLTAMYYAFMAPEVAAPSRQNRFLYFIRVDQFMEEAYDEAFVYGWTRWAENLLQDREEQFRTHMFPLAVIGSGSWELFYWVQDYERYWKDKEEEARQALDEEATTEAQHHAKHAREFGEHLKGITEDYQISYIELDQDLEIDKVCDIFTRINSRGIRLDVFDLINALLKPKGLQLKQMWREAAARLEFVESERMNVYILEVMSILRQAYCSPKYLYYLLPGQTRMIREPDGSLRREVLVPTVKDFENRWHQAVQALERAVNTLRDPHGFGVVSSEYLPYVSILPAFAALQEAARGIPANRQLGAERKIRHWYWASVFTNRYSGSVESTTARDFIDVKRWFDDDSAEPPLIAEFRDRFRHLDLRRETKRGSSVYNGIFNLLVVNGAKDWMTGASPQYGQLDDHHIVPRSWGREQGLEVVDSILNRTALTADTNRKVIRNRLPNEYLPELIAQNGEDTVQAILASHFISPTAFNILIRTPFTPNDFEEFLSERQRTIQEAIEELLLKERLDLSPRLRELDARTEQVELALRRLIADRLDGDIHQLPQHVLQRVNERIQRAMKRDAALDQQYLATLPGKLEYTDLRELQDCLGSKHLWPLFEEHFGNRETLVKRFDQLAQLRNAIRHSRSVDQVTSKEGEAALLWFEGVLPCRAHQSPDGAWV